MSPSLLLFAGCAAAVLLFLAWILRDPRKTGRKFEVEEFERSHVTYLPQVKQAMAEEDFQFLLERGNRELRSCVKKERQRVVLGYLRFLRNDFQKLWRLAKVIAKLSPKVGAVQEFERMRLGFLFYTHYTLIRFKFQFGFSPIPELGALSKMLGGLALRMESAMSELGEQAAATAKMASVLDGRHLDTP